MKYVATLILGRNSFLKLELENFDDPPDEVERDAEALARKLDARFMYIEAVDEHMVGDLPCA